MLNSPKTSTSFSQLQNAYDKLMSETCNTKTQQKNQSNQQKTHQQKNYHSSDSPFVTSLEEEPIKTDQFSFDMEEENQLGLNSKIEQNKSQKMEDSRKIQSNPSSTIFKQEQQKIMSSESSQQRRDKDKRAPEEERTQNTSSNSFSMKKQIEITKNSSNHLRKSVQNDTILNAIESMFRKKNSLNHEAREANNFKAFTNNNQRSDEKHEPKESRQIEEQKMRIKRRQKVILTQRLKNIHIFYRMKVDDELDNRRNNDRVFMNMLHQNEKIHRQRIGNLKKMISEEKRRKMSMTKRQKMITRIESTTQLSIFQRERDHQKYDKLHEQILKGRQRMSQKAIKLGALQKEQRVLREEVENNQKTQLKLKKWIREVQGHLIKGEQIIYNLKKVLQRDYDNY